MPKRKRTIEDDRPIPTPDRQLITSSGWCLDNIHQSCPYTFFFGKCGCSCHT